MNREQLHKQIFNTVCTLADNGQTMNNAEYRNHTQALSIMSSIRDARNIGRQLDRDNTITYIAAGPMWLNTFDTEQEARNWIAEQRNIDLFGAAIIKADRRNNTENYSAHF